MAASTLKINSPLMGAKTLLYRKIRLINESHKLAIYVEGNIGAGKSTFLKALQEHFANVLLEPVSEWPLLDDFYRDPPTYFIELQKQIMVSLEKRQKSALKMGYSFLERSLCSSLKVFGANCSQKYDIDIAELEEMYNACRTRQQGANVIEIFVFLDSTPKTCYDNIQRRIQGADGLACDKLIKYEYLKELDSAYADFIKEQDNVIVCKQDKMGYPDMRQFFIDLYDTLLHMCLLYKPDENNEATVSHEMQHFIKALE